MTSGRAKGSFATVLETSGKGRTSMTNNTADGTIGRPTRAPNSVQFVKGEQDANASGGNRPTMSIR